MVSGCRLCMESAMMWYWFYMGWSSSFSWIVRLIPEWIWISFKSKYHVYLFICCMFFIRASIVVTFMVIESLQEWLFQKYLSNNSASNYMPYVVLKVLCTTNLRIDCILSPAPCVCPLVSVFTCHSIASLTGLLLCLCLYLVLKGGKKEIVWNYISFWRIWIKKRGTT